MTKSAEPANTLETRPACRRCDYVQSQHHQPIQCHRPKIVPVQQGRYEDSGLNYQIVRKAQPLVAAYCAAQGVPYTRTTLWQSYRIVIGYLNTVGLRGKDPFLCPLVAQRRAL